MKVKLAVEVSMWPCSLFIISLLLLAGCGATNSRRATEQLLISDAVDRSVSQIDFRALAGKTVYFDRQFVNNVKGIDYVNADYIISSLRQQMFAAGCRLQDNFQDAEYIVEARVGTLGIDGHEVNFGVPPNNLLGTVSTLVPGSPTIPVIPEISFAKKDSNTGAAKIGVFAYHRETRRPLWQSGLVKSRSRSRDVWVLGAEPFQSGTIYEETQFAGARIEIPFVGHDEEQAPEPPVSYYAETRFPQPKRVESESKVVVASHDEAVDDKEDEREDEPQTDAPPEVDEAKSGSPTQKP